VADEKKQAELISAAEAAAFAAELASLNIRKYLELQGGDQAKFVMKIAPGAKFVMKIAEDTREATSSIVAQAAELAARNLQEFATRQRGK
jgi:hypothetical protein